MFLTQVAKYANYLHMILADKFMTKSKQEKGKQESKGKKTHSLRFSHPKYDVALERFSQLERRRPSDFLRVKVEITLDELMSAQN
jgi:hypothetical protein